MAIAAGDDRTDSQDNRVGLIISLVLTVTALQLFLSLGRLYARLRLKGGLRTEDWIMVVAAMFGSFCGAIAILASQYGAGYHIADMKAGWLQAYMKIILVYQVIFAIACTLPKVSLCITYLRFFPSNANRIFCHCAIVFVVCWCLAAICVAIFQCSPINAAWDPTIKAEHCIDLQAALVATAALNSLSDFLVYLWPTRTLWRIQLPVKQRVGLVFVFCVGAIVCVAGICRMYYIWQYFKSNDPFYFAASLWIVTVAEANFGVVCGCLHGIKPLLIAVFPRFFKPPSVHHSDSDPEAGNHQNLSTPHQSNPPSRSTSEDSVTKLEAARVKGGFYQSNEGELSSSHVSVAGWISVGKNQRDRELENGTGYMQNVVVDGARVCRIVAELKSLDEQEERNARVDPGSETGSEVNILPPQAVMR